MKRMLFMLAALAAATVAGAAPVPAGIPIPSGTPQSALFAGGCFWSLQNAFENVYGVITAVSGYTGGKTKNPTYQSYAGAGHLEAVLVTWDPARVSYAQLLDTYWHHTDPTDAGGQFVDRGPQYRPVLYYMNDGQRSGIEASEAALAKSGRFPGKIVTGVEKAGAFYPAEDYHQDYARKNPDNYQAYFQNSGRPQFFAKVWGKAALADPGAPPSAMNGAWTRPSVEQLKQKLNPMQFDVTQNDGTEPPFANEFDEFWQPGIYVDIVSGEPLFSSTDKFESGSGWPSFTRPLVPSNVVFVQDTTLGMVRTEVRSRYADSHLGHLFDDGPAPTGLRYCMDSAAMRFIPVSDMAKDGYGQYLYLFPKK